MTVAERVGSAMTPELPAAVEDHDTRTAGGRMRTQVPVGTHGRVSAGDQPVRERFLFAPDLRVVFARIDVAEPVADRFGFYLIRIRGQHPVDEQLPVAGKIEQVVGHIQNFVAANELIRRS